MAEKKKSWDYQKDRYKQVNIKFNLEDDYDRLIHFYLTCKVDNASRLIKELVYAYIGEGGYIEP